MKNDYRIHERAAQRVLSLLAESKIIIPVITGDPEHPVVLTASSGAVEQIAAAIAGPARPQRKARRVEKTISSF